MLCFPWLGKLRHGTSLQADYQAQLSRQPALALPLPLRLLLLAGSLPDVIDLVQSSSIRRVKVKYNRCSKDECSIIITIFKEGFMSDECVLFLRMSDFQFVESGKAF